MQTEGKRMGTELDLMGLTEKRTQKGTRYYVDGKGEIVAKECTDCSKVREMAEFGDHKERVGGKKPYCRKCQNERSRKYYEANSDMERERTRKWKEANSDKERERARKYYASHREERRGYQRKYNEVNEDKVRDRRRKYYESHKEAYYLAKLRRRARKAALPDDLTQQQQTEILEHFGYECALTGGSWSWDHAIPLAVGHVGTTRENMYPLRSNLNSSKQDACIFDWFADNRDRFELSQTKFDELIAYLADINGMTVEEYEAYVRWCHDNPRDLTKIDEDDAS